MHTRKTAIGRWPLIAPIAAVGLAICVYGFAAPEANSQVRTREPQVRTEKRSTSVEAPEVLVTRTCTSSEVSQMRICASGHCQEFRSSCFPYTCDDATRMCQERCINNHSCVRPTRCLRSQCVLPSWSCMTEGPNKGDLFDGIDKTVDCAPYRCYRGAFCPSHCSSTGDCEPPYRCSADGRCVRPEGR